ncbi:Bug family tripartite tricarboxylate transporter substrate binding protein [Acidovorax cavernicola]|uniref:Tripartite tricarboxylate transporter substrate binding protein n=1 Tax=Acidovorax cavernicola TaxID=1675792 RepID=A0A9X8D3P9_9BURK|nr:tripartite tricarboxylate transporter substrate binding protein [Acidovorax cavernicola]RIX78143.1 tripartite tricarboxylate transporter substrate binding protein [Acidovorax cavernicola]
MTDPTKRFLATALVAAAALAALLPASAMAQQAYPSRPVRLIVPWAPGTPADVAGRVVAERMSSGLGQTVFVENRPGAAGTVGLGEVLRQPADGYTVYMLSSASLVAPLLFPSQSLDLLKSLEPVGMTAWSYNVLVAPPGSPLGSPRELEAAAKARPGALSFGSGGNGTPAHLAGALFSQQTGSQLTHVPYNQFPMAVGDLLAGRLDTMFLTASAALPQIQAGKLRALAVTGARRLPGLPAVPTMIEQGYAGFELRSFDGMTVRSGTPREIVERLSDELAKAAASPEVRERLGTLALEPEPMTPARFRSVIAAESDKWLRIGRSAGIKAD